MVFWLGIFCTMYATVIFAANKNVQSGDAIALLVLILGYITKAEVANALAPYALIGICGFAGAVVKASSMSTEWRPRQALYFILGRVLLALVLTVSVAEIVNFFIPGLQPRYSFSLIAFALAGYYDEIKEKVPDIIKALVPEKWKGKNDGT